MTPWINDDIHCLKRECRKVECKWKNTKLEVHFIQMKELLSSFNKKVKEVRIAYFSNLIDCNKNNPRVLFSTIERLVNPVPVFSINVCEMFFIIF